MTFLFKIEEVFEIHGRGCVIVPVIAEQADFKIRPRDAVQLRTPDGRILNTHIGSVELLKPEVGRCKMAILLPTDIQKQEVPNESEMALFHECTPQCAQKELDTADIVREAMFQQLIQLINAAEVIHPAD